MREKPRAPVLFPRAALSFGVLAHCLDVSGIVMANKEVREDCPKRAPEVADVVMHGSTS
jgi:hypothetical protein